MQRIRLTTVGAFLCAAAIAIAGAPPVAALAPSSRGSVAGAITYLSESSLTIQTVGKKTGMVNALTRAANAVGAQDMPYVWGGGHGAAGMASVGSPGGRGFNGRRIGYDCSGAVAAVLAGAGLWAAGSPVPNDAGVIRQLLREGLIAPGAGRTPTEVTLFDRPGVHIFMNIDGRYFGTSDGGAGANSRGGAGWLDDGAPDASSRRFKPYHLLPSVLRDRTTYGHSYTFAIDPFSGLMYGAEVGDRVAVSYAGGSTGTMFARALDYVGAVTVTGTVTAIAPDESTVTIQTPAGETVTLSTSIVLDLITGLADGNQVQVTYARNASGLLVPHAVTVLATTAAPAP